MPYDIQNPNDIFPSPASNYYSHQTHTLYPVDSVVLVVVGDLRYGLCYVIGTDKAVFMVFIVLCIVIIYVCKMNQSLPWEHTSTSPLLLGGLLVLRGPLVMLAQKLCTQYR